MHHINVLPVIHVKDKHQALTNADIAFNLGADGVFFISHGDASQYDLARLSRENLLKDKNVGVNFLGLGRYDALELCGSLKMLWVDNAHITKTDSETFFNYKNEHFPHLKYYGGVAFKYQSQPDDMFVAGQSAKNKMDVLCTSGDGTGIAPAVTKLKELSKGFGARIAVASGVTPENVEPMLPYLSDILVATGVSDDFYNINPGKLKELIAVVRKG